MAVNGLEERIVGMGEKVLAEIRRDRPSLFNRNRWIGEVLRWSMENEDFKVQLFRFIDVFPSLSGKDSLGRHLREYFDREEGQIPGIFRRGSRFAGFLGDYLLNQAIGRNIRSVARQFIIGENAAEAVKRLTKIRQDGFAFTVDLLGEAVVGEEEADTVLDRYCGLVEALGQAAKGWRALAGPAGENGADWGSAPMVNLSVKPSALYSQIRPEDFEGSVAGVLDRLTKICEQVMRAKGFLCIDMESNRLKNVTLEIYRRLRLRFPHYPHLGLALQSYLKETDEDLEELLQWARDNAVSLSIRLVKGAYWEYEVAQARMRSWPVPVFTRKAESDAAFERHARRLLENHDICHLACASHNIRSVMAVLETARSLGAPAEKLEFQVLHGMAEPVAKAILKLTGRVRLYSPFGELIPGMAYLVRRLLENTSNESFLRHSFAEGADSALLLRNPLDILAEEPPAETTPDGAAKPFVNEPVPDFSVKRNRHAMAAALTAARSQLGRTYGFVVNGRESFSRNLLVSHNPARLGEVVGRVCQVGMGEVREAVAAAKAAFPSWRDKSAGERAGLMRKTAAVARERFYELASWQVLEVGKQWEQACGDVAEAIDFLDYYALHMERLGRGTEISLQYGESDRLVYEGKGVAAVIAPWNFPMAISCGMIAAALVAGNCVVYKPSERSSVCGRMVFDLFAAAGLPAGVLHLVPGYGHVVGEFLVEHPDICMIAFTGSLKAGLQIVEKAGRMQAGQQKIKKVIAEMGGKNAIIIDDDADLDEAVPAVVQSAFGFQGQKCSACSRLIVLEPVYERFLARLLGAVRSLKVGAAEDPAHFMGAVIDDRARKAIFSYIELGKKEGTLLYCGPEEGEGHHVPMTIFGSILPHHRLAREEIFGPVLAIMKAKDFSEALEFANSSPFALTGGLFSRSPSRIEEAMRRFQVGNLYINRGITGALVGRQPFGGFRMSGLGSKAGGSDYLQNFLEAKVICENTLRRGFAPESASLP
ncbi:MAG: bifunctional proline dehydrogenase/L-glutamate gamma-semialdehyde dehydrogenase [Deltaproteobacteria bacterium]|nr:bifunctional proline dehydrogenase/L-glutamate gamma-semialdehyde dehydrogenase [Deltaproteobacteria bacterium]